MDIQQLERSNREIHVIVDHRESASGVVEALRAIPGVTVSLETLVVGDYLVDGRLIIERKTLSDLAASIKEGRLLRQALRLAASEYRPAILLEGKGSDLAGCGMRREAIQGALISISLLMGIPILRSLEPAESAQLMVYAVRQIRSSASGALPRYGKRPKGKRRLQLYLLQGLPGVGPERAQWLLEHFGTVEAVMTASVSDLSEVRGIGDKTARAIRWSVSEETQQYRLGTLPSPSLPQEP